jgi:outer membrane biogenesis lipoprotein LolB
MKGEMRYFPLALAAIILAACAQAGSTRAEDSLNPGDRTGGFLITTAGKRR